MHCLRLARRPSILALAASLTAVLTAACQSTSSTPAPPPVSPDAWAVVDGKEIKSDQVEKTFRRMVSDAPSLSQEEALAAKLGLLDDLIVEEILLAKATALKVEVSESDVDNAFAEAKKNIPDANFQQELTRRNLTAADMRDGLRRELITRKLLEQEVGAKVTITDQQVSDFFNANRAQFNLAEDAFHLAQIVITPQRDQQIANRTGDDAATPQAAAAKVQMLMERLKSGTPFGDLARDFSEDPQSAPRGGDLGLVPLSSVKQAPAPLRDAVLQVTPGSARVVSQNGNHTIVFVVAKEPAGQRDLSMPDVRQRITDALKGRREQVLRAAYLAAARTDADIVNYMARRVVESQGQVPSLPLASPGVK
jgi:peptidyl-prolyl cis-trans isomerase SurA